MNGSTEPFLSPDPQDYEQNEIYEADYHEAIDLQDNKQIGIIPQTQVLSTLVNHSHQ